MPNLTPFESPVKEARTMIRFKFGKTSEIFATTWKGPVYFKGNLYRSEPGIEIKLPKQSGGLNEDSMEMTLPVTRQAVHPELRAMAAEIYSPRAVPKTQVEIFQLIDSEGGQKVVYLYEGTMERSRSNPSGNVGKVELHFQSELRYGLDRISLGRRCDPECDAHFGKAGCGHPSGNGYRQFDSSTYYPNHIPLAPTDVRSGWVIATVDPVDARKVSLVLNPAVHNTLQVFNTLAFMPRGYWIGSFLVDRASDGTGLSIPIQTWEVATNDFVLSQVPPKTWDGKSLFLQVDCSKTREACIFRINTDRFNGLGYGIPDYNPTTGSRTR